jgi:hypothetical protein
VRRHKASESELVESYLCAPEGTGGVGMMERDAVKFLVKLSSWAERVQNDIIAADRDYDTEARVW